MRLFVCHCSIFHVNVQLIQSRLRHPQLKSMESYNQVELHEPMINQQIEYQKRSGQRLHYIQLQNLPCSKTMNQSINPCDKLNLDQVQHHTWGHAFY